jgi:hypothetical protein
MHCYTSGHIHSLTIATAFSKGSGLPLVGTENGLLPGGVFTYGNLRGLKPILDRAIAEGREWIYADNGYFRPGHYNGYYRVTRNAYQHDGGGTANPDRWQALGKHIKPWKRSGKFVMVCPPSAGLAQLRGFDAGLWLADTLAQLKAFTNRELVVRAKPAKGKPTVQLWDSLRGCHALVTHSSNTAVEALLFGVPVFCTDTCASYGMGLPDLSRIETPYYPDDRERWVQVLAANQWTLDEMKDGTCWRQLTGR